MAFIEPMHRNKPNITYLFTPWIAMGTIGKEERPPRGQLWMEQYLISLKYWPI